MIWMQIFARLRVGFLFAPPVLLLSSVAFADIIVMSSDIPAIKTRSILHDNDSIDVPPGKALRVIMQSGKALEIKGPRRGKISEIVEPIPINAKLWATLIEYVRTGGADFSRPVGGRGHNASGELLLNDVPLTGAGIVCVEQDKQPQIKRLGGGGAVNVRVVDNSRSREALVSLTSGANAEWPAEIKLTDGARFLLQVADDPQIEITVRVLESAKIYGNDVLSEFHAHGCMAQLKALLDREMPGRSKM